jgi:hypothetical protein
MSSVSKSGAKTWIAAVTKSSRRCNDNVMLVRAAALLVKNCLGLCAFHNDMLTTAVLRD